VCSFAELVSFSRSRALTWTTFQRALLHVFKVLLFFDKTPSAFWNYSSKCGKSSKGSKVFDSSCDFRGFRGVEDVYVDKTK
jgi:hypothetical protein